NARCTEFGERAVCDGYFGNSHGVTPLLRACAGFWLCRVGLLARATATRVSLGGGSLGTCLLCRVGLLARATATRVSLGGGSLGTCLLCRVGDIFHKPF